MALFKVEDSHLLNLEKMSLFYFASLESKTKYPGEYSSQFSVLDGALFISLSDKSMAGAAPKMSPK